MVNLAGDKPSADVRGLRGPLLHNTQRQRTNFESLNFFIPSLSVTSQTWALKYESSSLIAPLMSSVGRISPVHSSR